MKYEEKRLIHLKASSSKLREQKNRLGDTTGEGTEGVEENWRSVSSEGSPSSPAPSPYLRSRSESGPAVLQREEPEEDGFPVKRCTKLMKSWGLVWMTFDVRRYTTTGTRRSCSPLEAAGFFILHESLPTFGGGGFGPCSSRPEEEGMMVVFHCQNCSIASHLRTSLSYKTTSHTVWLARW